MKKYLAMIGNILLFAFVWYGIFGGCMMAFQKLSAVNETFKNFFNNYFYISYLILSFLGIACLFLIFKFRKINGFKFWRVQKTSLKTLLLAAGYGIAVGVFSSCFGYMDFFHSKFPSIGDYFVSLTNMSFILFFVIVGADSIFKETLFRGSIMNELHRKIPLTWAILIQAILYGCMLFYSDFPTRVYGVVGNIIFALIYVLSGSIFASILVQLFSYITMYVVGLNNFGHGFLMQFDVYLVIISAIIMLVPFVLYFKKNMNANFPRYKDKE